MMREKRPGLTQKDRTALGAAAVAAVAGALIWLLWVLPISASVEQAQSRPLGRTISVELEAGEGAGIWASGISPTLGTSECTVRGPGGDTATQGGAPSLNWDDTLWWMTPRQGFEQISRFTAAETGAHEVRCTDALDTYDGEFLLAGDAFGDGAVGLGRSGAAEFAVGTFLAFCAVVLPAFAILLPIVIGLRLLVARHHPAVA